MPRGPAGELHALLLVEFGALWQSTLTEVLTEEITWSVVSKSHDFQLFLPFHLFSRLIDLCLQLQPGRLPSGVIFSITDSRLWRLSLTFCTCASADFDGCMSLSLFKLLPAWPASVLED